MCLTPVVLNFFFSFLVPCPRAHLRSCQNRAWRNKKGGQNSLETINRAPSLPLSQADSLISRSEITRTALEKAYFYPSSNIEIWFSIERQGFRHHHRVCSRIAKISALEIVLSEEGDVN